MYGCDLSKNVHRPGWSIAEVCRRYQVSRKTGYKWLERYEKAGPAGLVDRSHRPWTGRIVDHLGRAARREGGNHKGSVTNQLITKCHLSSELFTSSASRIALASSARPPRAAALPLNAALVLSSHASGIAASASARPSSTAVLYDGARKSGMAGPIPSRRLSSMEPAKSSGSYRWRWGRERATAIR